MPKIIHIADLHLGTSFYSLDDERAKIRRQELIDEFDKIISVVRSENVGYLLIAGDLFDNSTCVQTAEYVSAKFGKIPRTRIIIAAGNHDPQKGIYNKITWPRNVHIFDNKMARLTFDDCVIYGASFETEYQKSSLLKRVRTEKEKPSILVMHGDFRDADYNLLNRGALSVFDYAALGHVHKHKGIERLGMSYYAYAGMLAPRGFDETGSGGFLIGEVDVGSVVLERRITNTRKYRTLKYNLGEYENINELLEEIKTDVSKRDLFRINLVGEKNFDIPTGFLESELKDYCFYAEVKLDIDEQIDYAEFANDYSLLGIFVRNMIKKITSEKNKQQQQIYRNALKCGVDALKGRGDLFD